jgi:hypothetical protein
MCCPDASVGKYFTWEQEASRYRLYVFDVEHFLFCPIFQDHRVQFYIIYNYSIYFFRYLAFFKADYG